MNPAAIRSVLSESEYDLARAKIRETYGDDRQQAGTRWEHELALLFYRSGWTQEQLAAKEGKSQPWVAYQLRFGRFLVFADNITDCYNLREGKFRELWASTNAYKDDELERFRRILGELERPSAKSTASTGLTRQIVESFADSEWHADDEIQKKVGAPETAVTDALRHLCGGRRKGYSAEFRKHGKGRQYRIFPHGDRMISSSELKTKLLPILKQLKAEGKKSTVTMSPGTVAYLTDALFKLLEAWAE